MKKRMRGKSKHHDSVWISRKDLAKGLWQEGGKRPKTQWRGNKLFILGEKKESPFLLLDMLIHDARQYLMIATGELKSIEEEGTLALEEPTRDIQKVIIRAKRLKGQCMRLAGRTGLDWQGVGEP